MTGVQTCALPISDLPALEKLAAWEVWCKEDESRTVVRFVTCFQTSEEEVRGFLQELARLL